MRRKIPSHSALLAFEAAARHGSFARAAEELALTEGAISRQIARLETFLGVSLFKRVGNRVRLAPNGTRYAAQVREILDRLERDSLYLMGQPAEGASIDIAAIPTFATRWLIPRLKRFQQRHPNVTVHIAECMEPFLLAGSGFDAAIHFDHPAWAGMHRHHLLEEVLVPVCSPVLLAEAGDNASLDALPRLHRRQNPDAWQVYAQASGIELTNSAIGARYDLHAMLIEAALAGLGVALVPRLYIGAELAEGRLVAPWPDAGSVAKNFCLVLPEPIESSDGPLQAFAHWLLEEARGVAMENRDRNAD
ncbi:DNA-binding transcriptional LysR family regulator [Paraburkholderia tropica]|uniref:LysR substrate-binding domain-containing protein n=1 Tax=Paraburkholderia tropica TaxID=92647 RepID=UPI00160FE126|nr:LysR substrate-binding domain-containing protein [Paraburkholderia tropica]MBB3000706.1 DNA-binding transcriptional LysR family regulator [Paraburkholderia tropica]MBB6320335.1 DNA-binding transcriptional LysR family regulator [Paraburkholderia tropica]